jgi:hypothetical protein
VLLHNGKCRIIFTRSLRASVKRVDTVRCQVIGHSPDIKRVDNSVHEVVLAADQRATSGSTRRAAARLLDAFLARQFGGGEVERTAAPTAAHPA